jgi:hypothetical protein
MRNNLRFRPVSLAFGAALAGAAVAAAAFATPARAADDVSQTRHVAGFDRIELDGAFKATVTAGAGRTKVVVGGEPDVVDRVTTEVKDRTLIVGMRRGTHWLSGSPTLVVELPALRGFTISGAGTAKISGLTGGDVAFANNGAGTMTISGRAENESISLNGAGKIDATGVDARDVTVDNNGVGGIYVRASGTLSMNVNGVGEIKYAGNPTHVDRQVNGIGRIERM